MSKKTMPAITESNGSIKPRATTPTASRRPSSRSSIVTSGPASASRKASKSPYLATPADIRGFQNPDAKRPVPTSPTNQKSPTNNQRPSTLNTDGWPTAHDRKGFELTHAFQGLQSTWEERDKTLGELKSMINEMQMELPPSHSQLQTAKAMQTRRTAGSAGAKRQPTATANPQPKWDNSTSLTPSPTNLGSAKSKPRIADVLPPKPRSRSSPSSAKSSAGSTTRRAKMFSVTTDPLLLSSSLGTLAFTSTYGIDGPLPPYSSIPDPTNHFSPPYGFSSDMLSALGGSPSPPLDGPSSVQRLPFLNSSHMASADDKRTQGVYSTMNRIIEKSNTGSEDLHTFISNLEGSMPPVDLSGDISNLSQKGGHANPGLSQNPGYYYSHQSSPPYGSMYPAGPYQQPPSPYGGSPPGGGGGGGLSNSPSMRPASSASFGSTFYTNSANPFLNGTYSRAPSAASSDAFLPPSSTGDQHAQLSNSYYYQQQQQQQHYMGGGASRPGTSGYTGYGGMYPYQAYGGYYPPPTAVSVPPSAASSDQFPPPPQASMSSLQPSSVQQTSSSSLPVIPQKSDSASPSPDSQMRQRATPSPSFSDHSFPPQSSPAQPMEAPNKPPLPSAVAAPTIPSSAQPSSTLLPKLGLNTSAPRQEKRLTTAAITEDQPSAAETQEQANPAAQEAQPEVTAFTEVSEDVVKSIFSKVRHNKVKEVEDAIDSGVPMEIRDSFGNTPLCVACQNGHKQLIKTLLKRGADLNSINHKGHTALHFCFAYGYSDLGEYLISKGADDGIKNIYGMTCYEGLGPRQ